VQSDTVYKSGQKSIVKVETRGEYLRPLPLPYYVVEYPKILKTPSSSKSIQSSFREIEIETVMEIEIELHSHLEQDESSEV
jgi:hypothetical protein